MDKLIVNHKICNDISIALCTCEGSLFLPVQLESLADQSMLPRELVVLDDASEDNTVQVIETYAEEAPFNVRLVVNEKRLGAVQNFSRALALCRSQYIALCDQDDTWLPDRLESSLKAMQEAEKKWGNSMPLLIHSDLKVVSAEGEIINSSFMKMRKIRHINSQPLKKLLAQNFVTGCTVLINRSLADIALPIPEKAVMHDWWLALVAAAKGKIIYEPKPTVLYRRHGKNVIGAKGYYSEENLKRLTNIHQLEKELASTIKQAKVLQKSLKNLPGNYDYPELDHYLAAVEFGGIMAAYTTVKYGINKAGLLRSLVFNLLLLKRGYISDLRP